MGGKERCELMVESFCAPLTCYLSSRSATLSFVALPETLSFPHRKSNHLPFYRYHIAVISNTYMHVGSTGRSQANESPFIVNRE